MDRNSLLVMTPTWGELVLVLCLGVALAGVIRVASTSSVISRVRNLSMRFVVLSVAAVTLIFMCVGFQQTAVHEHQFARATPLPQQTSAQPPFTSFTQVELPLDTSPSSVPSEQPTVPSRLVPRLNGRIILLAAGVIIVWIFLAAFSRRIPHRESVPETDTADEQTPMGWLVIPAVCGGVLIYLAAPAFTQRPPDHVSQSLALSPELQQRTEKALRDLIANRDLSSPAIPDWLTQATPANDEYLLSSQFFSSREEADSELLPHAADLLQRAFHRDHPWQGSWEVPLTQVRERVIAQEHVERRTISTENHQREVYRVHMLIRVPPEIRNTFIDSWKSQIVQRRLSILGVMTVWIAAICLVIQSFYWKLLSTRRRPSGFRAFQAVTAVLILTVIAAWVLIDLNQHRPQFFS